MIQDILGQPEAGKIGGKVDLDAERRYDDRFLPRDLQSIINGQLSGAQGSDADTVAVAHAETLSPDAPGKTQAKTVPFWALLALVLVGYIVIKE
jgi:hypothetical protein